MIQSNPIVQFSNEFKCDAQEFMDVEDILFLSSSNFSRVYASSEMFLSHRFIPFVCINKDFARVICHIHASRVRYSCVIASIYNNDKILD